MTQRTENLLGVLALLVTDEMNAQPTEPALAGSTARAMLNAIGQYPDSSIEVLREAVDLSHPAAVRAVAGLVEAAFVEKKTGADKRSVALALTASGKREVKRLQSARDRILQRIVGQLDEREREVFENLLIKILWHETRDPAHAMQLCRLCDDGPCLKAGCPVECREQGLPMPAQSSL
ncbi:MarR family winged helix-turn-helix transcriptional regulator [Paraburkholderia fungorum]|jgi:DNA-binding MarR family transcriptional regulator|uniref:DNA-binding MarR family transcriptional regulator n=1 Tax=Paraburkholderia fungorum TaxID=134537 RepID=A0AAW3V4L9_9BURK|nr:MarR family winged helix-turn-helix transcriptional regulator [Paraburkholderia fungorum]MBB4516190.1 DNA-binding MarR family transcriptional regulator [Paraburkholderia fungorum]MBB5541429.1 DNA-binding MarR family transcriptional regulator [Paraburkholderia fungorum]MBB6204705.1 DNA-binding MarR family transcriptional regulator [Paraburkholderia fungorum]PNE54577.1 MarR family transcriptional regulator [Paraburkholderia fungorum]PZR50864.1 MAG: MarR family transcriptional regulator [Parab